MRKLLLALASFWASALHADIILQNYVQGTPSSSEVASITIQHTLLAASNRLIVVKVASERDSTGSHTISVTYNGTSMSHVAGTSNGGSSQAYGSSMYYLKEADLPANGGPYDVVISAVSNNAYLNGVVEEWSGVDQTTPVQNGNVASGSSGPAPTIDITSASGNVVTDGVVYRHSSITLSVGAGQTQIVGDHEAPQKLSFYTSYEAGAATVTMSWSFSSSNTAWRLAAFSIKSDGSGATPTNTPTNTPTSTNTPTITNTPALTFTSTKTPTKTSTPTITTTPTLTTTVTGCSANQWYIATTGSGSGTGAIGNPWGINQIRQPPSAVKAGDTIWVRGGTYQFQQMTPTSGPSGRTFYASGNVGCPLKIRGYVPAGTTKPERVIFTDSGNDTTPGAAIMFIGGSYVWYWDIEVTSSGNAIRVARTPSTTGNDDLTTFTTGIYFRNDLGNLPGVKFIHCIVHDTRLALAPQNATALQLESSMGLYFYNGNEGPDRYHGQAVYQQPNCSDPKPSHKFYGDIWAYNFAYNHQSFGSDTICGSNVVMDHLTSYMAGAISAVPPGVNAGNAETTWQGGALTLHDTIQNSYFYSTASGGGRFQIGSNGIQWTACAPNCVIDFTLTNNLIADETSLLNVAVPSGMTVTGNTLIYNTQHDIDCTNWPSNTCITPRSTYAGATQVYVDPSPYVNGRGKVTIYNPAQNATVSVNLSTILTIGSTYTIYHALDPWGTVGGAVLSGTYAGGSLNFPMTGLSYLPIVGTGPSPTFTPLTITQASPIFAAFIVYTDTISTTPTTTASNTPTNTFTQTPTATITPTFTATPTITLTPTATGTITQTPTNTPTDVPGTPTSTPACALVNIQLGGTMVNCIARPVGQ